MNNKVDSRKIVLIILSTLILIGIIGLIFYINLTKDTSIDITATVKYTTPDYIIVTTEENEEYLLRPIDKFHEGDKVLVNIDNIDDEKEPKEAEIKRIELLSRSVTFTISDSNTEDTATDSSDNNTNTSRTTIKTEEDIITSFENINREVDNNNSLTEEIKNGFVSIVDFIFYNKEISGYTFSSLSTTAKLKVLEIALSIDEKIDNKFPNYKENLSDKYQDIKSKVVEKYLDITSSVCANNEDTCNSAKEGLTDLKENFSITWSFVKDIAGIGISKLKSWYEVWRTT